METLILSPSLSLLEPFFLAFRKFGLDNELCFRRCRPHTNTHDYISLGLEL